MIKLKFNHIVAAIFSICIAAACSVAEENDMTLAARDLPQAELETLCENRNGSACSYVALNLMKNPAAAQHEAQIKDYLEKGCNYDSGSACYLIGGRAKSGKKEPKDTLTAATYFSKACRLGNFFSCNELGYDDNESSGILGYTPEAEKFYRPLCDDGDWNACFALGKIVAMDEGRPTRKSESIQLYIKGCEGGNAISCHMAAYMLTLIELFDNQNPYDTSHYTFKYWDKACELGHKNSCNEVKKYKENYGQ